ncbi:hypothetical protein EWB00_010009 [Schistosoma japonicum]|uniref:Uncharacterized protein n=1 Tax=Schistosoma japonicum TaxID=6182 RepID=A0A4Z2DQ75_SCHJA|nr:hypothetical protein EWB00_010009 [Schistosoma japonicum]
MASSCSTSHDHDPSKLIIKVWEFFASAATGLCQLYKGKIDHCADFQNLLDTLSSIERFYRGSQNSVEAALSYGKVIGSQYLRLHLRDLAYENVQTITSDNGVEVYVPLESLLLGSTETFDHSRKLKRKRSRHCAYCPRLSKRIALDHCGHRPCRNKRSKAKPAFFPVFNTVSSDTPLYDVISGLNENASVRIGDEVVNSIVPNSLSTSEAFIPPINSFVNHSNISQLVCDGLIQRRKRHHHILPDYQASNSYSCDSSSYPNESINRDPFNVFHDAVQIINLLDPLSKFSVTSSPGTLQNSFKRPRVESPNSSKNDLNSNDVL